MKIAVIIVGILFAYLAFSTIFHNSHLAGKIGTVVGSTNIKLFGYLAYINIFLLFVPLYRAFKKVALLKDIEFYAGWILFFVSMVILPALILTAPASGSISTVIYTTLVPSIGKAGMWFFWLMTLSISIVLIIDDDFSFDFIKEWLFQKKESFSSGLRGFFSLNFLRKFIDWIPNAKVKKSQAYSDIMTPITNPKREQILEQRGKKKSSYGKRASVSQGSTEAQDASTLLATTQPIQYESNTPKLKHNTTVVIVEELEENSKLLEEIEKGHVAKPKNFKLPKLEFLQKVTIKSKKVNEHEIDRKIRELLDKLGRFKIEGDVTRTYSGPLVTTFEFKPAPNVKVSKVLNLQDDLAMALSAETIRIQAPIPGRNVIGIEIPNEEFETIYLREILESKLFQESKSPLTIALGKDIVGKPFITDLKKLPHLLIAGTTGSGKSVGINAMILSLLYRNDPDQLKLVLVDPKMLEFSIYNDIPHLLTPVITEAKKAISALANLVLEMERRYKQMAEAKVKNIETYNEKMQRANSQEMPYIVIVIDELADLMMNGGKEVEYSIARLAQMARASGIHLIIATQRPSVDVVTGLIKANLPSRLSYRVGQKIDSKVILDTMGAESLLGRGDALFTPPGMNGIVRLHAPWNTEAEIDDIVEYIKAQRAPEYDESYLMISGTAENGDEIYATDSIELDPLYPQAKDIILEDKKTSISYLQRKLQIGYNRSANIIDQLEKGGVLSPPNNKGNREIL